MAYRMLVLPRKKRRNVSPAKKTQVPQGFSDMQTYLTVSLLGEQSFSGFLPDALEGLEAISSPVAFPKGAILFAEGQHPRGVFVIRSGRGKLTATSGDGLSLLFRIAGPGDLIGLPGTISGKPLGLTAEALESIQATFIPRDSFLEFLRQNGEAALRVAEIVTELYHGTYREARYLGLSGSATEKLARFLLDLIPDKSEKAPRIRVRLAFTHQEIAGMIGTCRETVTRLIADFKRNRLIEIHGSTLVIINKAALMRLLEGA